MFAELEVFGKYRGLDGHIQGKWLLKSLLKMSITLCKTFNEINYVNIYEASRSVRGKCGFSGKTTSFLRKQKGVDL